MEVRVTNVKVKLNEEETRICEGIIKRIQENSKRIREIDMESTEGVSDYTDGINEIMEEVMGNEIEINEEDINNMEEVNETIRKYGNSFIKEIFEEIMKEGKKDEGNSSEELSELEDEPPKENRKRRREDESQETRKRNRTERKSRTIEKLIQELEIPVFEEENIEEETEEDTEGSEIRILIRMFYGIEKVNRKQIKEWFNYGRRFEQNVEETRNRSRKRIADQTARGKVYEEMKKQMPGIVTKEALRKRTQGAVKVYEIFMEIGREKINRNKDCTVDTIIKLNREEIKQIKNHFRRK